MVLRNVEREPMTKSEATTLRSALRDLAAAGDERTREPLNLLLVPLQAFVEGVDTSGETDAGVTSTLDAVQAFDDGVLAFNDECLTVGARVL